MYISLIRSIIMFLLMFIIVRLMGKRQLGEMQPFELVITLLIADLACTPLTDTTIPLFYGIVPIVVLCAMHFLLSFLARKSVKLRTLISGKPMIAITPDGIDFKVLKQLNLNLNDLIEAMRGVDVFYLEDINYGIFETNGSFCAIKNDEPEFERGLPVMLVADGKLLPENLEQMGVSQKQINKLLMDNKIKSVKDVLVLTLDEMANMYLQAKGKSFVSAQNVCEVKAG